MYLAFISLFNVERVGFSNATCGFQVTTDGRSASTLFKKIKPIGTWPMANRTYFFDSLDQNDDVDQVAPENDEDNDAELEFVYQEILEDEQMEDEIFADWEHLHDGDFLMDEDVVDEPPANTYNGFISQETKDDWEGKFEAVMQYFDRIIALDPNVKNLAQFVDHKGRFGKYTTDEYYQRAFNASREWRAHRIKDSWRIQWILEEIKLTDITSMDITKYMEAVAIRLETFDYRDQFFNEIHDFRSEKFSTYRHEQNAFNDIANVITQNGKYKKVLIAFGNWSGTRNYKLKGRKPPVMKLRKYLRSRFDMFCLLDEFRTSACCSMCQDNDCRMNNCVVPFVDPGMCDLSSYNSTKRIDTGEVFLGRTHHLLYCERCGMKWGRDLNAAVNLMNVLANLVAGIERPLYLRRGN